MRDIERAEAEMTFLPEDQGGRHALPVFTTPSMYRPHVVVGGGEYLGVVFLSAPEAVLAGIPFIATLGLVYHPQVDYSALVPGAEFTIREGSHLVGHGRVLKRWSEHEP
jgi:translation elongation factor EF-Tu-like GTPase